MDMWTCGQVVRWTGSQSVDKQRRYTYKLFIRITFSATKPHHIGCYSTIVPLFIHTCVCIIE